MAYSPTTWASGDTITATKLNKIEQGIADRTTSLVANMTYTNSTYVLDKTFEEIYNSLSDGEPVFIRWHRDNGDTYGENYLFPVITTYSYFSMKRIVVYWHKTVINGATSTMDNFPAIAQFTATSVSSYPTFTRINYVPASVMIVSTDADPYA